MATFKGIKLQSLLCALKSLAALGTKVSLVLFQVCTCLSNMFTQYIQNLEIYNAFIISEPEFTV